MKVMITWKKFQPGPVSETGLGFSNGLKNTQKVHVIEIKYQPRLKKEREHAHQSHLSKFSHANLRFAPGMKFIV